MIFRRVKMSNGTEWGLVGSLVRAAIQVAGPILRTQIEKEMKALQAKAEQTKMWPDDIAVILAELLLKVE
jgi:hypothetical protein